MTDSAKEFLTSIQQDEQLKTELEALEKTVEGKKPVEARGELARAVVAIAKEHGFALTEDDFRSPESRLDDAELTAVAGGTCQALGGTSGGCGCVVLGGGAGKDDDYVAGVLCLCIAAGYGDTHKGEYACFCPLGGAGR